MLRLRYQGNLNKGDRTRALELRDGNLIVLRGQTADFTDEEVDDLSGLRILVPSSDTPVPVGSPVDTTIRDVKIMGAPQPGETIEYVPELDLWVPGRFQAFRGMWQADVQYSADDIVIWSGALWRAIVDNIGSTFSESDWVSIITSGSGSQGTPGLAPVSIAVTNSHTDPRATSPTKFSALAPGGGTVDQVPTAKVDGLRQLAVAKNCVEIKATPAAGNYAALKTNLRSWNQHIKPNPGSPMMAARMAGKVVAAAGNWHAELWETYYNGSDAKIAEVPIWSGRPALNTWFEAEGFDNQLPSTTLYAELELRVYGSTGQVTLRGTELVHVVDPDGDIPYYVGGDLYSKQSGKFADTDLFAYWQGAADNSTSTGSFDPDAVYPDQHFGFNDFLTYASFMTPSQSIEVMKAIGASVSRANGTVLPVPATGSMSPLTMPDFVPEGIAYLKRLAAADIKVVFGVGVASWMLAGGTDWWPTTAQGRAAYAASVVKAIEDVGPDNILGISMMNEPNGTQPLTGTSYGTMVTAVTRAVHAAHPGIKVLAGVLSMGGGVANASALTFLGEAYAAGMEYDWLDIHPYPIATSGWANSSGPVRTAGTQLFGLDDGIDVTLFKLKDKLAQLGDPSRPLFVSEVGALATTTERMQMQTLALCVGRLRRDPQVVGVCVHTALSNQQVISGGLSAGIFDERNFKPRAAAHRLANMRGKRISPSADESTRFDSSPGANAAQSPGGLIANRGTQNQILVGTVFNGPGMFAGQAGPGATAAPQAYLVATTAGWSTSGIVAAAAAPTLVALAAQGAPAQTRSLLEARNSSATVLTVIDNAGNILSTQKAVIGAFAADDCQIAATAAADRPALIAYGFTGGASDIQQWKTVAAGVFLAVGIDGILRWVKAANQQTTVGAAGGASALPATPAKYLKVKDSAGTTLVVPAYNP